VDPGIHGGIVVRSVVDQSTSFRKPVEQCQMPGRLEGLIDLFGRIAQLCPVQNPSPLFGGVHEGICERRAIVYVEHLQPFPLMSRKGVWTLAENYGQLIAAIRNAGFVAKRVRPKEWQTTLNVRCHGDKKRLWEFAKAIYPAVTLDCADAFLISEFGICDLAAQEFSGQSFLSEYYLFG
jgi:hypothetical protein